VLRSESWVLTQSLAFARSCWLPPAPSH